MRKSITLLITMLFIVVSAWSQEPISGTCGDNATWSFNAETGTLTISGTGAMWNYSFDTDNNRLTYPWWHIIDDFKSLVIEEGITSIGDISFTSCTSLTSASLPTTLTVIGNDAFSNCNKLQEIALPAGLKTIGDYALSACAFTQLDLSACKELTTINQGAFYQCTKLQSIKLPTTLQSIGQVAFLKVV